MDARTEDIAAALRATRERIGAACAGAGRSVDEVTLVAVTKTYPATDVVRLAALGLRDVGESRDQEAAPKAAEVAAAGTRVDWHFVGRLQRNKCQSVAAYATAVHSVDSVPLAAALAVAAARVRESPLDVLVQVSLDGDPSRGGAVVGGQPRLEAVLEAVAAGEALRLRGLMAVAPLEWEPADAYDQLAAIAGAVRAVYPAATWLSAGMSGDLEAAVAHGSTHVRVGSALLGKRSPLR